MKHSLIRFGPHFHEVHFGRVKTGLGGECDSGSADQFAEKRADRGGGGKVMPRSAPDAGTFPLVVAEFLMVESHLDKVIERIGATSGEIRKGLEQPVRGRFGRAEKSHGIEGAVETVSRRNAAWPAGPTVQDWAT